MAERGSLDALGSSTLGQYRIRGRIGSGGMGDVYDAVHTALDKRVAIKTLRRRFLEDSIVVARFLREGQLASRMRHPHIVDMTDVGLIDGLPCLVMEHLDGETLGQVIKRDGALKPSALVDLLLPIIAAVDFAHEHGVLHRDLKPSNIFLARAWNGEVLPKVLDFGISKLVTEGADAALTTDSSFVGTPHYASPESVRAERAPDRRSDQYSMGVILYEGTCGVRPFAEKGGSFVNMAMAICAGDFKKPRVVNPQLPESFEQVILKAMAIDAEERYPTMRQLGVALLPFASERARVIWTPSFRGEGTESTVSPPEQNQTQLMRHPNPPPSMAPQPSQPPSVPSHPSHPTGPMQGWAASGAPPYSSRSIHTGHGAHAANIMLGSTPAPSQILGLSAGHPQYRATVHDPTPSFGAGIQSSVSPVSQKKGAGAWVALGVLAVVVFGGVALVSIRAHRDAAAAQALAQPSTFAIDVQATPESAVFELDGAAIGSGHFAKTFNRDGQEHVLRVSAPGYETVLVQFDETRAPPSLLALRASASALPGTNAPAGNANSGGVIAPPKVNAPPPPPVQNGIGRNAPPPAATKAKPDRPRTDNIDPWE